MITEQHWRRLQASERRLERLKNNPAPTVPIYDMSVPASGTAYTYMIFENGTDTETFPSPTPAAQCSVFAGLSPRTHSYQTFAQAGQVLDCILFQQFGGPPVTGAGFVTWDGTNLSINWNPPQAIGYTYTIAIPDTGASISGIASGTNWTLGPLNAGLSSSQISFFVASIDVSGFAKYGECGMIKEGVSGLYDAYTDPLYSTLMNSLNYVSDGAGTWIVDFSVP